MNEHQLMSDYMVCSNVIMDMRRKLMVLHTWIIIDRGLLWVEGGLQAFYAFGIYSECIHFSG